MEKLEKEFLENGGEWKEVSIEELFYSVNGDFDIQNKHLKKRGELVISSGNTERGIVGRTDVKAKIIAENCITVDMFGNVYARDFPFKMVTHARVFALIPKEKMNIKVLNYIAGNMFYLTKIHGYSSMATFDKIKGLCIELPFLNGKINFSFMEKFIEELEAERIEELEAYLIATGLKDYHLTKEDEKILDEFEKIRIYDNSPGKTRLGDLFTIMPTKSYNVTNSKLYSKNGKNPVVSNTSINNGIGGYTNLEITEKGNIITYSDTTTDSGIFYQPKDFVGYSHVQGLYPKSNKEYNENEFFYIVTCFKSQAKGRFDYANKFNRKIAKEILIDLPIKNKNIDYEFMEKFIEVVKKLVIKDVVIWADKKIEAAKKIVNSN